MEQEILYGAVKAVVFQNPENGYTVLRLLTQDGETVTVSGHHSHDGSGGAAVHHRPLDGPRLLRQAV